MEYLAVIDICLIIFVWHLQYNLTHKVNHNISD
jgi:hypothetical protein